MSEAAGAPQVNRGTAFFGFVLGHEDRTYLEAINETTFDLFNSLYAQTGHTWHLTPELELRGDLQFADQRSVGSNQIGVFATQFFWGAARHQLRGRRADAGLQPHGEKRGHFRSL